MEERNKILNQHQYKIWTGKDGYIRTYLPDVEKGRRLIKKATEEAIYDAIVEYYKKNTAKQLESFKTVYDYWLKEYSIRFDSPNTLTKYGTDYARFFKGRDIEYKLITEFSDEYLTNYIIKLIKELLLCKKACKTLCGYIRHVFHSAKVRKLISDNPFEYIETNQFYQYCTENVKTAKERTISNDEFSLLYEMFERDHRTKPYYIPTYAVEFASLTGFRAGEIAALRWSDLQDGCIVVDNSEKHIRETNERIIGKTKNKKKRYMPITQDIAELLQRVYMIEKEYGYLSEFIFSNESGRVSASTISSCAKNKCLQLGIPVKSIHTYRRTFSSKLKCNGVSTTVVSALLGHTEEVNEQYYTYDITERSEKLAMVEMVNKEIKNTRYRKAENLITEDAPANLKR